MQINVVYDPSVNAGNFSGGASEEADFKSAINYVINLYDNLFTNNITFTIDVGWGEYGEVTSANLGGTSGGTPIGTNALAGNQTTSSYISGGGTYTLIKNALEVNAGGQQSDLAIFQALPNSDPLPTSNTFTLPIEQAEMLGIQSFSGSGDNVGFATTPGNSSWYFGIGTAASGETDFIAAAEHEISEGMGRVADVGSGGTDSILDLFRYSSPGHRDLAAVASGSTDTAYFSTDGGVTSGGTFNNDVTYTGFNPPNTSGPYDLGDWAPGGGTGPGGADAYADGTPGFLPLTLGDLEVMNAIGWNLSFNSTTIPGGVTDYLAPGQSVSGFTVLSGGYIEVGGGIDGGVNGSALNTTVSSGGNFIIDGLAKGVTIHSGGNVVVGIDPAFGTIGVLDVLSGNTASGVSISGGIGGAGIVNVSAGGVAVDTHVSLDEAGGLLEVAGLASNTTVASNGTVNVLKGGTAVGTTIEFNGVLIVESGGSARDTTIDGGPGDLEVAGLASNTTVSANGSMTVLEGGTAVGTTIGFFGTLTVSSGGTARGIDGGGLEYVDAGGTASNTVISSGNITDSGGIDYSTIISSGGLETVDAGGVAESPAVDLGGDLVVSSSGEIFNAKVLGSALIDSGGTAAETVISGGGIETVSGIDFFATIDGDQYVSRGGVATDATVDNGGIQTVSQGVTSNTNLAGGHENVGLGGSAIDTIIGSGGFEFIQSGGAATGTVVETSGVEVVESGGRASGTIVLSGGQEDIGFIFVSGGTAIGTTVQAGGTQNVLVGGTASATLDQGEQDIGSGGQATDTVVSSGGVEVVEAGGSALDTTVYSGGILQVSSGGVATGVTVNNGGLLEIFGGGSAENHIESGGTREVFSGSVSTGAVLSGGTEEIGSGNTLEGYGLGPGRTLEVASAATAIGTIIGSGGVEDVESGGTDIGATIENGGQEYALSGSMASGATVSSGGMLTIYATFSGITVENGAIVAVSSGGTLDVLSGDAVNGVTLYGSGVEEISSGATVTNTIVSSGGADAILIGGTASNTIVDSGGGEVVGFALFGGTGGTAIGTIVNDGGIQYVAAGSADGTILRQGDQVVYGAASGTIISSGGLETVSSGGTTTGTMVSSGGTLELIGGAIASGTTVSTGGTLEELGGSIASGTTFSSGAILEIASGLSLSNFVTGGVSLEVASGGMASGVTVDSGDALTVFDGGTLQGDIVDNGTLNFDIAGNATFSGTLTGSGTLVVSGGGHLDVVSAYTGTSQIDDTSTLEFTSTYVGVATFSGSSTGPGGTLKFDVPSTGPINVVNPNDTVIAQPGSNNWINATVSYTLPANIDALFLYAGAQGTGNSAPAGDALYALNAGSTQTLTGNSPSDTFVVYNSSDVVVPKAGSHDVVYSAVSYTLPTGVDSLILEAGTQAVGNSDAAGDALYAANPIQVATLTGNSANDTFVVYNSADLVVPKAGSHDVVYSAVSYTLPTGVDVLILEAGTQGVGNSDAAGDALYAANPIQVATLTGNSANDTFVVYNSADLVVPKAGSHDIVYSAVNYTLPTGVNSLILEAGTQAVGNSDAAGDTLYAANAGIAQALTGHSHNDTFVVYNSGDTVIGQASSTDTVYAAANFTLSTNVDTLFLEGNASHGTGNSDAVDALFGNAGVASTLVAGSGADILSVTGTAGTILTGGAGHDTFAFPNVMGKDEVTNFGLAEDTLQFNATLFSNFTAAMNDATQVGANTVFTIDANDTVTLDNVTKTSLTAGNFHFT